MLQSNGRTQDWVWRREQFAETFGERSKGGFVKRWPADKRMAIVLTLTLQSQNTRPAFGLPETSIIAI
jgi:hypothetical protein